MNNLGDHPDESDVVTSSSVNPYPTRLRTVNNRNSKQTPTAEEVLYDPSGIHQHQQPTSSNSSAIAASSIPSTSAPPTTKKFTSRLPRSSSRVPTSLNAHENTQRSSQATYNHYRIDRNSNGTAVGNNNKDVLESTSQTFIDRDVGASKFSMTAHDQAETEFVELITQNDEEFGSLTDEVIHLRRYKEKAMKEFVFFNECIGRMEKHFHVDRESEGVTEVESGMGIDMGEETDEINGEQSVDSEVGTESHTSEQPDEMSEGEYESEGGAKVDSGSGMAGEADVNMVEQSVEKEYGNEIETPEEPNEMAEDNYVELAAEETKHECQGGGTSETAGEQSGSLTRDLHNEVGIGAGNGTGEGEDEGMAVEKTESGGQGMGVGETAVIQAGSTTWDMHNEVGSGSINRFNAVYKPDLSKDWEFLKGLDGRREDDRKLAVERQANRDAEKKFFAAQLALISSSRNGSDTGICVDRESFGRVISEWGRRVGFTIDEVCNIVEEEKKRQMSGGNNGINGCLKRRRGDGIEEGEEDGSDELGGVNKEEERGHKHRKGFVGFWEVVYKGVAKWVF
ncbi:hypothetical protein HDU76_009432, partial [Blyttiomyces sp. JEL0837]